MIVTADELARIHRQALEEYPAECCGVILTRGEERTLLRCVNSQNKFHAKDPARYPRDARSAYNISPKDLLKIADAQGEGYTLSVIYHSHIDTGAYFSDTDRRTALCGGEEPHYSDAVHVVVSVMGREVADTRAYRWDPAARDFLPMPEAL